MPRRTFGLVYFNDRRCRTFTELRSVITEARALALGEVERQRAAAVVERWLLAALDEERTATVAAATTGPPFILGPPASEDLRLGPSIMRG
jgi:hypothetical protein